MVVVGGAHVELAVGSAEGTADSKAERVVDKVLDSHEFNDFVAVVQRERIKQSFLVIVDGAVAVSLLGVVNGGAWREFSATIKECVALVL